MKPILVLYATREGHTRRIAEYIAAEIRARGLSAETLDARTLVGEFAWGAYGAAVLAASVHAGKHEPEMVAFVRKHKSTLERMNTAFLSVSLSEAGVEDASASPAKRAEAERGVREMLDRFFEDTGWHPGRVKAVAGALLYTKYNVLIRFVMKQISKRAGGSTDTSRDHEYTDWAALHAFVGELVESLPPSGPARAELG